MNEPKRKLRWFQFRLRTVFIAIAVIALQIELIAGPMRQVEREQARRRPPEYHSLKHLVMTK